ncbi:mechanosensitive ion channel domain-containing protein [uncultured Flavobacterium sp.]|uniref:mechanosensitive ion channel family protein n=1 Tax=uncultured Flavobacterium sp. TaxID=165435 RepID=UPI0030CA1E2B
MKIYNWTYTLLTNLQLESTLTLYLNLVVNIVILIAIALFLDYIFKKLLIIALAIIAAKTKSTFDDFLVANKTAKYIAHLIPLYYVYITVPIILAKFISWEEFFSKGIKIYIIILSLWIVRSVFNSLKDYLKNMPRYSDKPIDSYIQVIMIVLWFFGGTSFILIMFDTSFTFLISTFGAISALIFLIFKDTILGFVASIQVSVNDMVRIGDWITMDKFGADGDVIEINLATVKVRNFDNTTTTIPTYSLISDSFINWRGMLISDGRRIKRSILIKPSTVQFIKDEELVEYEKLQLLKSYIDHKQADIQKHNTLKAIDKTVILNGRNLTNLGLFRKYIQAYLENHSGINQNMLLMVRYLQPSELGIPLEIYCFSNDKVWENYEHIIADVLDHVIASSSYFKLEILEMDFKTK